MSREYTKDEVRAKFLNHVWSLIDYWEAEDRISSNRGKLEGLAFSMLVLLDGGTSLPGFRVLPDPHPDDKQYHQGRGEDYFPEATIDIAGGLHELFHSVGKER